MYFKPPSYGYALICHFVYLAILATRPLSMIKQKLVCFIYMQPQKVKFTSFQINMKQVSYKELLVLLTLTFLLKQLEANMCSVINVQH